PERLRAGKGAVVNQRANGGPVAAQRTAAVATVADFLEGHRHRVVQEDPVDKTIPHLGDELDGFGGLDRSDDAGQRRQHADLLGFSYGAGRRRLRVQAAITTAARLKHGDLSFDAKDAAVHQRLLEEVSGVTEQLPGAPAPTIKTRDCISRCWPTGPISARVRWRA